MEALAPDRQELLGRMLYRLKSGNALKDNDPLSFWHFSSEQSREGASLLTQGVDELLLRGPNVGGKTECQYALALAMLQKRPTLDGVPLPQWRGRVDAISLELDYPTQKLSSQQTVLRLLGRWPHHAKWKGDDILSSLLIKPLNGNDDQSTWSTLTFMSQENRRSGTGVRSDLVLANEPPDMDIWREVRKARHAGRRGVRIIGMTPIHRRRWQRIKDEYGDCPRDTVRRVGRYWAEARWSLWHNKALGREHVEQLLIEYGRDRPEQSRDPLYDARVHGDYIDTTGLCPFDSATLQLMLADCIDPEVREWNITREVNGENGLARKNVKVKVHVLNDARIGATYWLGIDPSKGIDSPTHDPGGVLVSEMGTGEDMAMYEGYIGSYGLGVLGAGLAHTQYADSVVDPESNSGWSEGVLRGLSDSSYGNIAKTQKMLQPGTWETKLGFETTDITRPAMIQAIQEWVESYRIGLPYARCRFRRIIETLLDTILDEKGKPVAAPGFHDEFLILKGQSLRKTITKRHDPMVARARVKAPTPRREPTLEEMLAQNERHGGNGAIGRTGPLRPKLRPVR